MRCAGQLIAGSGFLHKFLDQAKVLQAQRDRERRVIVASKNRRDIVLQHETVGGTALHHMPPEFRFKACKLGRHHRLADGRCVNLPELVVYEFRDITVAVLADPAEFAHRLDHWPRPLDVLILAADKHRHVAPNRRIDRAGHRRIDG